MPVTSRTQKIWALTLAIVAAAVLGIGAEALAQANPFGTGPGPAPARNLRAELKVEQKPKVPIQIFTHDPEIRTLLEQNINAIERLATADKITFVDKSLSNLPASRHTAHFDVHVIYEKKIDIAAERERLKKDLQGYEKEIANLDRQLSNEQFLSKAPSHVIENMRKRRQELEILREKTKRKLEELG